MFPNIMANLTICCNWYMFCSRWVYKLRRRFLWESFKKIYNGSMFANIVFKLTVCNKLYVHFSSWVLMLRRITVLKTSQMTITFSELHFEILQLHTQTNTLVTKSSLTVSLRHEENEDAKKNEDVDVGSHSGDGLHIKKTKLNHSNWKTNPTIH